MSNVLSWKAAIGSGYEPRLYPYAAKEIPSGQYLAVLDFKVWSKRACTLNCYFTAQQTGQKFQLSVFRRDADKVYAPAGCEIDFRDCPVNATYLISVTLNPNNKAVLLQAAPAGV